MPPSVTALCSRAATRLPAGHQGDGQEVRVDPMAEGGVVPDTGQKEDSEEPDEGDDTVSVAVASIGWWQ